ncbi:MAG: hypothetical protein GOVbin5663_46 [Prokaryotic dsDNA virus sp.]|nr:MAG: hypothetical protein GOVbin5663_46 [Prokaryotic dsDNA virus sp.]|tara:strand:- start:12958 stop:13254 length:297 start_codon:yes stop_codon:yes gene_type:complete
MKDNLKQLVKEALELSVYVRNSDHKLVAWIWRQELKDQWGDDVINLLNMDKLTSWESIARCRRKIQEEHPELRGEAWNDRQKKSVEVAVDMTNYEPTL